MTPAEERLAKIVELGEAVLFEHAEAEGSMTDEQMREARQRLRFIGREVSRLPEKFKAAYKDSVPWEVMSEWADPHRFEEASFDLEVLTGCCGTLEVALPELSRHSGGHTSIQEKIAGDLDLMSSEKASDLDRYRQASLIHIAVTILLLSVRAMLVEAGWSYIFMEITAYCLLLIPLWRVMRANEVLFDTAQPCLSTLTISSLTHRSTTSHCEKNKPTCSNWKRNCCRKQSGTEKRFWHGEQGG